MFILQNLLFAVARVLDVALTIFMWLIIARVVLSWVRLDARNVVVQFIFRTTEPVLYWIRRRLPTNLGGLDISPLLAILAIYFAQLLVVRSLAGLAQHLN